MLLSLQNLFRRRPLDRFTRLLAYSTGAHLCLIVTFALFRSHDVERIMIVDDDIPVVVLPLYKTINAPQASASKKSMHNKSAGARSRREYHAASSYERKKASAPGTARTTKSSEPEIVEYTSSARKRKLKPDMAPTARKKRTAQVEEHGELKKEPEGAPAAAPQPEHPDQQDQEQVLYIGREQAADRAEHRQLRQALMQVWHAPVGVTVATPCEIMVELDRDGNVVQAKVVVSSGVPVFDSTARMATLRTQFPRTAWGKTCMLVFG